MRLLYPKNNRNQKSPVVPKPMMDIISADLELDKLAAAISLNPDTPLPAADMIELISSDTDTIKMRQEICRNLYDNENLFNDMKKVLEKLRTLQAVAEDRSSVTDKSINNYVITVNWIEHFCNSMVELQSIFERYSEEITASSLKELGEISAALIKTEKFRTIKINISGMKRRAMSIKGIKMGVNLNEYLEPVSVSCLEAVDQLHYPKKVLDVSLSDKRQYNGIGKFRYMPRGKGSGNNKRYDQGLAPTVLAKSTKLQRFATCKIDIGYIKSIDSYFKTLNFNSRISVRNFIVESTGEIFEALDDMEFILGGVGFAKKLTHSGMPVCLADISSGETIKFMAKEIYNCHLPMIIDAPEKNIVKNDVTFEEESPFAILNGPNKGGKTTIIQAMALNTILFQLGLYSACSEAEITPADRILTHYQREEGGTLKGRLENEMIEIKTLFKYISKKSLVFFNEPYVSTSPTEGMELILELVKAIKSIGLRGILVTHYHQINDRLDDMNDEADKRIKFMNMGIESNGSDRKRTFRLKMGKGEVKSFAEDILREYAPEILD